MHALLKAHMHIYILLRSRVRLVSLTRREKIEKSVCFACEKEMRRQSNIPMSLVFGSFVFVCTLDLFVGVTSG